VSARHGCDVIRLQFAGHDKFSSAASAAPEILR
jgi:hypothetical protein